MRSRGKWYWGVPALLLVVAVAAAPTSRAPAIDGAFDTRGSVGQVSVVHAAPGAQLDLENESGAVVGSAVADEFGSALWRDLAPDTKYRVKAQHDGTTTVGAPVTVLAPTTTPDTAHYTAQKLAEGFGYITARDGTTLSATVHLPGPADAGPYPTVVEYSATASDPNNPPASTLVAQSLGYATVSVNVRGTGCSGGALSYFEQILATDGYDVVEVVAAQPWVANGAVGLVGIADPAGTDLSVAATQPPHLAAVAPLAAAADPWRSLYPGGIPNTGLVTWWAKARAEQAKPFGLGWEQAIVDAGGATGTQCAQNQLLRLQNQDLAEVIATYPFDDATGTNPLAPVAVAEAIDIPTYVSGTWQDELNGAGFAAVWSRLANGRMVATNGPQLDSLLADVTGWHDFLEFYIARRIPTVSDDVRALAPLVIESKLGTAGVQLGPDRFADYTTYEEALAAYEAEARVRVVLENGSDQPTALNFAAWPPTEAQATDWWFHPGAALGTEAPQVDDADAQASSTFTHDPATKLGSGITEWRATPAGSALAFDSAPLAGDTVMAGAGAVDLWVRTAATDVDLEVTLTEVAADGSVTYVQSGWLRASHRTSHAEADNAPLPAGEFTAARVEFLPFAHAFRAGSRIRIAVEAPGGNQPLWGFGASPAVGVDVGHSVGHASRVTLPVVPNIAVADTAPACGSLRGQPCRLGSTGRQPEPDPEVAAAARAVVAPAALAQQESVETTTTLPPEDLEDPDFTGQTVTFEQLDPNDPLYPLAQQCQAGDMVACDDLYAGSNFGSALEAYADTCGGTKEVGSGGFCDYDEEFDDGFTEDESFDESYDEELGLSETSGEFDQTAFDQQTSDGLAMTGDSSREIGLTAAALLIIGGMIVLATRTPGSSPAYAEVTPRKRRRRTP
ncbi:MAG: CocE/NonD family hydrolase [Actinomycetota bacterium]|nr:CocE/NonD family hydrolase [Actinomycetota bacterium]